MSITIQNLQNSPEQFAIIASKARFLLKKRTFDQSIDLTDDQWAVLERIVEVQGLVDQGSLSLQDGIQRRLLRDITLSPGLIEDTVSRIYENRRPALPTVPSHEHRSICHPPMPTHPSAGVSTTPAVRLVAPYRPPNMNFKPVRTRKDLHNIKPPPPPPKMRHAYEGVPRHILQRHLKILDAAELPRAMTRLQELQDRRRKKASAASTGYDSDGHPPPPEIHLSPPPSSKLNAESSDSETSASEDESLPIPPPPTSTPPPGVVVRPVVGKGSHTASREEIRTETPPPPPPPLTDRAESPIPPPPPMVD